MLTSLAPSTGRAFCYSRVAVNADELLRLRPLLQAVLSKRLGLPRGHADVEDAEAEVMRRALEGRAQLADSRPLRPWLMGIARHVAIDMLRNRARVPLAQLDAQESVDPRPSPSDNLQARQRIRRFEKALADLPKTQRQSLVMFHLHGHSYRLIAQQLNVPLGSVCSWVARARRQVVQRMKEEEQ